MKNLMVLVLTLLSFGFVGSWTETKAGAAAGFGKPQVRIELGRVLVYDETANELWTSVKLF